MSVDLSVIVIARNEEAKIGACLDACIRSIKRARESGLLKTAELILSDSASSDRTVEISRSFPVTIVELPSSWPLSAAAGRFVGLRHTDGELVLFVDGDYVLFDDWLPEAIVVLRGDPTICAVTGRDVEEFTGDSVLMRYSKKSLDSLVGEPEAIPIGLYRRSAIDSAGGLHPFLKGGEDRDLAQRLRNMGYRLVRLNREMGLHRWAEVGPLDYVTYFRSVVAWSIGDGQVFRIRSGVPSVRRETRRRYANVRHVLNYFVGLLLVLITLINLASPFVRLVWAAIFVDLALAAYLLAVKSLRKWTWRELGFQLHVVPYSILRHAGFLLGFLRKPRSPSDYPKGEHLVQKVPPVGGEE